MATAEEEQEISIGNVTPYPLHPTPYTLHLTPYTLHPTPYTLYLTPYTLHPTPYTIYLSPYPQVRGMFKDVAFLSEEEVEKQQVNPRH